MNKQRWAHKLVAPNRVTVLHCVYNMCSKWTLAACVHPPCSLLKVIGNRKVQSSKSHNYVTVANRIHVDMTFHSVLGQ
jgi:hypothetical protein